MPPRRSTRSTAASTSAAAQTAPSPPPKPAPKRKATAAKSKKRAAKDDNDDDDDVGDDKPASKRQKTTQDDEDAVQQVVNGDGDDEEEEVELKRGIAPVDPTTHYVVTHKVYTEGDQIYDAMLNQTNISANNNKFYVIQILCPKNTDSNYLVFTRWGRVGENGQNAVKGPFSSPAQAIAEFKKVFKSKSSVAWESRHGMVAAPGKYTWIERSYEEAKPVSKKAKEDYIIPDSKLEPPLQQFCNLIFSSDLMSATLSAMNYDAQKLPLGQLSNNTILRGFAALKELSEVINAPNGPKAKSLGGFASACDTLSAAYYSIIPHAFGRQRPVPVKTKQQLKSELELVGALSDMEITQKVMDDERPTDANGNPINPLDKHFHSLNLKFMNPIDANSSEFSVLQNYVTSTHGHTHSHYTGKILQAFRVERHDERDRWDNAGHQKLQDGERLLLWHGSRSTNFCGILKQGLRIAPPEAPVTGYMFGKGVYFADAFSKSANYCYAHASDNIGVMLLCEVAAKPFYEQVHANYHAQSECGKAQKLATKGLGRTQPKDWQDAGEALGHEELKGCWMPKDGLTNVDSTAYLQYNEYIVYDTAQIKLRYLMMIKMN
ncbi:related to NAD+ ADP-ribosyltransferase [Serendipita indica DSM 11827]|uniref:Poly [ADP-ribose] polymerase n=1 Tax=Serendipita indica (strain DSM 11827) TaxID=1109443 RepID=G4TDK7_SERID|nr:related to NAD+ ADP-ribosyltransferase [Serendipita indica DSM 11827]